ncbi:MAG: UDP-N-acetylmuramate dehydrogenase [Nitrospira sp.]|nr:UDP-N-acetylmuramate dehydrogenase [Candidatus Manganitrophaceae bacterium]HIL33806.1 UDP-N-acetylmuramate dehydrogenase [Candidatus Manganitrophaceae bacterium]
MILTKMNLDKKNNGVLSEALEDYTGEIRWKEPIAPYTSFKVGGPAEVMVFPKTVSEVAFLMNRISSHQLPWFILGGGSNLLVRDGGIKGVVLHLKHLQQIEEKGSGLLVAEAGVSFPKLSTTSKEKGLSGLEFAIGIPGTVGGAVVMNAGIPNEETEAVLKELTLVDEAGKIQPYSRADIPFGYRSAHLPKGVVVSASFQLRPASVRQIDEKMKYLLKRRRETQPLSFPSVGSVFKNPEKGYAGKIIEACGLKGSRCGDAQISERHGNFIVNCGSAKAEDVLDLIHRVRERVLEVEGILLEPEVKVVGVDSVDRGTL